jgi:hypothetical protein
LIEQANQSVVRLYKKATLHRFARSLIPRLCQLIQHYYGSLQFLSPI